MGNDGRNAERNETQTLGLHTLLGVAYFSQCRGRTCQHRPRQGRID